VNTPAVLIRSARPDDVEALAALAARTFRDAFGSQNDPADLALHVARHYSLDHMGAEIADPATTTLLAVVDDQLAGYAQLFDRPAPVAPPAGVTGPGRMLHRFYFDQAWVGRGLAQPLMAAVKADAIRRGAAFLWLTVWERNPRAIAFYRKSGFGVVGSTTFEVGNDRQQDWVMTCPL
jgi:ribosomal protein S18 acetylase RimI-like enzyme